MFVDFFAKQLAQTNQRLRERGLACVSVDRFAGHRERPIRANYRFEEPLDMGLSVSPVGGRLLEGLMRSSTSLSDERHHRALHGEFTLHADEATRLSSLMTPDLTDYVFARYRAGEDPWLDDAGCAVVLGGSGAGLSLQQSTIDGLLGSLEVLVRHIEDARRDVPVAGPLAPLAQALEALGSENASLSRTPLRFSRLRRGRALHVRSTRVSKLRYRATLSLGFEAPLDIGLSVRPRTIWHGLGVLFGRPAAVVGDEGFDKAFHVAALADDGPSLGDLLPKPVRQAICDLGERVGEVHVDDAQIRVSPSVAQLRLLGTGAALADAIAAMEELAERIERARWGRTEAGPYR